MNNKLVCPFCGETMEECKGELHDFYGCHKTSCFEKYGWFSASVLQALIQAKQDLEIATKALEEYADEDMWENCCKWDIEYMQGLFLEHGYEIAKEALEQIEQKEERNESIRSNIDD